MTAAAANARELDARVGLLNEMTAHELCHAMSSSGIRFDPSDSESALRYTLFKNGPRVPLAMLEKSAHRLRQAGTSGPAGGDDPSSGSGPGPGPGVSPEQGRLANADIVSGTIKALVIELYRPKPVQATVTALTNAANELVGPIGVGIIAPNGLLRTPSAVRAQAAQVAQAAHIAPAAVAASMVLVECPGVSPGTVSLVLPAVASIARSIITSVMSSVGAAPVRGGPPPRSNAHSAADASDREQERHAAKIHSFVVERAAERKRFADARAALEDRDELDAFDEGNF
jgi:hypothetical protein